MKTLKSILVEILEKLKEDLDKYARSLLKKHLLERAKDRKVPLSPSYMEKILDYIDIINAKAGRKLQQEFRLGQEFHLEIPETHPHKGFLILKVERRNYPYPVILPVTVYGIDEKTGTQMFPDEYSMEFSQALKKMKKYF